MLGSTNQATAAAVHVEQRNGEIPSHFQLLPVRTEARVSVPPHPLDEGQPQKTSAGTLQGPFQGVWSTSGTPVRRAQAGCGCRPPLNVWFALRGTLRGLAQSAELLSIMGMRSRPSSPTSLPGSMGSPGADFISSSSLRGITWILDGLEVTIVGSIEPVLQSPLTLGLTAGEIGGAGSAYVTGAVIGALIFGRMTDRFGRRLIFYVTLIVYLAGVLLTATSWSFWSFALFRAITGFGIGGEYAAINSAIDELMPARYRGRIDIVINGSFWVGAVAGSGASLIFLNPNVFAPNVGWRLAFAVGGVLCLGILLMRRHVPESPRWLVTHGFARQADATVADIEQRVRADTGRELEPAQGRLEMHPRRTFGFGLIARAMLGKYRSRSILALALMIAQAFLYNAVFFSYALVLVRYHGVASERTGTHLVTLAASNFLGPLLLGRFFDTIGRRTMITATYGISGVLLIATAVAFGLDAFSAWGQDLRLDADLLLCFRRGELRLSHRERDLSPGDAGAGDRHLLCLGHGGGRHGSAAPLRLSRAIRLGLGARGGLRVRRNPDADCGRDRGEIRHRRGDALA